MRISLSLACLAAVTVASPALLSLNPPEPRQPVVIHVHADQPIGPYKPIWNFFGADEPNYIYAPNGKKLLAELANLSRVPVYFRPHNLFTTGNGDSSLKWGSTNVYTEKPDGTPVYDFTITDKIYDALVAAHVRPLVEIGFMPEALSTHPEPYRHTFPKEERPGAGIWTGWTYPPKNYDKWSKLVLAYATHLRDRYGAQTSDWLWEVWNEPDVPYWQGTPAEYDRLYDVSAAAIRQALPHARIGGPEATGVSDHSEPFLRQFLEHCAHGTNAATGGKGAPLDFISYHPKGSPKFVDGHTAGASGDKSSSPGHVVMSIGTQLRATERGMKVIAGYPEWQHTPIILGESDPEGCAACQGTQNGYRNGTLYGVSVAEATMRTYELARKYNLTVEGAVTWAFEFEDQPAFAGFRELATNGIDKPVLNVFRLMSMLGQGHRGHSESDRGASTYQQGQWISVQSSGALPLADIVAKSAVAAPDINAVATVNGNEVDILVWNYHDADVPAEPARVRLAIDGLKSDGDEGMTSGKLTATEYIVDQTHGNTYQAWQQAGSPAHPTPRQVHQLQNAGAFEAQPISDVSMKDGVAGLEISIPRQGVALISLVSR
jgi:xylan 1,4-beta-xylosidase